MTTFTNNCRICLTTKSEDDLECIYKENNGEKVLTDLGRIYQDVLNIMVFPDHTPQYFCTYCTLQLRLFQKFKKKALQSYNLFIKSVCKEEYISECNDDDDIKEKLVIMDLEMDKDDESSQDENFVGFVDSDEFEEVQYLEEFVTVNVDLAEVDTYDEYSNIDNSDSNLQENKKSKLKNKKKKRGKITKEDIDHEEEESSQVIKSLRIYRSSSNQSLSDADYSVQSDNDIDEDSLEKTKNKPKSKDRVKTEQFENYPCKYCDKVFHTKYAMDAHRKKYHPRTKYPCHLCQKTFFSEESLQVHINVHNGLPAYKCEECEKTFKQKAHFVYHMMGHRNERNVQCHLCGKGFLNNSDLRIHLRVHNDERRYECDVCGKRFRAHTHMTNHRYSHFEKRLECEMCLQKYSSPNTLRTHIKAVHKGECPYECETCSRKFKRKHHLKAHYRIHQKNRIYMKPEPQSSESIEWTLE